MALSVCVAALMVERWKLKLS